LLCAARARVEAALGLQDNHDFNSRRNFPKINATKRVARRLAAALNDVGAADVYDELFNVRAISFMAVGA
jgi:hypothetical protein